MHQQYGRVNISPFIVRVSFIQRVEVPLCRSIPVHIAEEGAEVGTEEGGEHVVTSVSHIHSRGALSGL